MAEPAPALRMTVADFVHWDDGTDTRYELAHGAPVAMAPPSGRHAEIMRNIARSLARSSKDHAVSCRAQASRERKRTINSASRT